MSAENVEIVEALLPEPEVDLLELFREEETWANLMDVFGDIFHPSLKTGLIGIGDGSTRDGLEGFRQTWIEWLAPWEAYRTETERLVDCGENVLVLVRDYGRREGTSAEVRLNGAAIWTVRDRKVAAAYFYVNRQDAFDALGLSDDAAQGYTRP